MRRFVLFPLIAACIQHCLYWKIVLPGVRFDCATTCLFPGGSLVLCHPQLGSGWLLHLFILFPCHWDLACICKRMYVLAVKRER